MTNEMVKLREMLDNAGIDWQDNSVYQFGTHFQRTKFINKFGEPCSVIYIEGMSYGWQGGFLESMPALSRDPEYADEVQGWLTADEIAAEWL